MTIDQEHGHNVVYLTDQFPAVSQTFVIDQIASLVDAGINVEVFATARATSGLVHQRARDMLGQTRFASDGLAWRLSRLMPNPLRRRLRAVLGARLRKKALAQAQLVICHFGYVGLAAAQASQATRSRSQIWTFFHGFDISSWLETHGDQAYRPLFERGDRFLAISELWMNKLVALGCPPDRISLLRMGVDTDAIAFAPRPIAEGGAVHLLTVGRLIEKKGTEFILRALARLRETAPAVNWHLTVAGDGPLRGQLEELAAALGIAPEVTFTGSISSADVKDLLKSAHIFALPSVVAGNGDMEGIPVALMEAMAAGVSVVSTVHSGIPELIEDRVSGLLAPERNIEVLADHFRTMCTDELQRMSMLQEARSTIERKFNHRKIAESFIKQVAAQVSAEKGRPTP
jgi:colanic acid/amylovoran biosynthesis glycosyltransferase